MESGSKLLAGCISRCWLAAYPTGDWPLVLMFAKLARICDGGWCLGVRQFSPAPAALCTLRVAGCGACSLGAGTLGSVQLPATRWGSTAVAHRQGGFTNKLALPALSNAVVCHRLPAGGRASSALHMWEAPGGRAYLWNRVEHVHRCSTEW